MGKVTGPYQGEAGLFGFSLSILGEGRGAGEESRSLGVGGGEPSESRGGKEWFVEGGVGATVL